MFYFQGGLKGSVLTYHCSHGYDPFPVRQRLCDADGDWSVMISANGRPVSRATCKGKSWIAVGQGRCLSYILSCLPESGCALPPLEKLCPAQLQVENGDFWPRDQWFRPGTMQSFSCNGGFHPVRLGTQELHPFTRVDRNQPHV